MKMKIWLIFIYIFLLNTGYAFASEKTVAVSENKNEPANRKTNKAAANSYINTSDVSFVDGRFVENDRKDRAKTSVAKSTDTKMQREYESGMLNVRAIGQDVDKETYEKLLRSFEKEYIVAENKKGQNKINIYAELRYHYSFEHGDKKDWNRNQSGLRLYLGVNAPINKDWSVFGVLESQKDIHNYNDKTDYNSLYVRGRIGTSFLTVGAFGYLMEEGNVYDSRFRGVRAEFGDTVKYAFAYGNTRETKQTTVFTAKYSDYDYDLRGGIYNFKTNEDSRNNTILTAGYNYYFSNFSVGILGLRASLGDASGNKNGLVLGVRYSEAMSYRPGTYEIFARYYDQARHTYIAHGMNGIGTRMNGFKGYGIGTVYVPIKNTSVNLEYYKLKDKVSGERGNNLWLSVSYYL